MEEKKYTEEDFKADIEWLCGYGIKEREAESFILWLLEKQKAF